MEPSNNYQTTVDADTFHPRTHDPEDVAQVSDDERHTRERSDDDGGIPLPTKALITSFFPKFHPFFASHGPQQVATGSEGLPAPDPNSEGVPKLDIDGGTVAMDAMGPVVGTCTPLPELHKTD